MTRNIAFAIMVLLGASLSVNAQETKTKPNILFIFADDQCFDTINSLGNKEIRTPNLDRLVRRGTVFERAYNMGGWGGAICVASRTMLNTGRFIWRARAVDSEKERVEGRLWTSYLKQAGYRTYMCGKWHVKAKAQLTFDVTGHVRGGMPAQTKEGYNRPLSEGDRRWSPYDKSKGGFWQGGKHWSEIVGDESISFIDQAAKEDEPFFMYLAFNAPHDPRQSPKEFVDMYPLSKVSVPANFLPVYPYKDPMGCPAKLRDEALAPFPRTEYAVKVNRQEYYAIITHMDAQIGLILDALEESGKADNTYIFFTADHGLAVGQHGLLGKQNLYDHSVRVPFIVAGPGIQSAAKKAVPIYLQDVVPTTLELAGVKKPDHVEFRSLMPLLRGDRDKQDESIYGCYGEHQRMVTHGEWKLIWYPKAEKLRLYNVKDDPAEMQDLAGNPAHTKKIEELKGRLRRLQKQMGDAISI
jgi:choline-sulfatase